VRAANPENIIDVVRFDEIDILTETSEIAYSLTSRILARKDVPDSEEEKPQARELISWRISEKYYFNPTFGGAVTPGSSVPIYPTISLTGFAFPEGRRLSPVNSVLKFAPSSNYDTEFRTDLDPNGGGLLNAGITSHIQRGPVSLALTDYFVDHMLLLPSPLAPSIPVTQLPSFNLLSTLVSYTRPAHKGLTGTFRVDYNIEQGKAQDVVAEASYNFGCFGVNFGFQRFNLGFLRRESAFRVSFSLANIGTFGNLKPEERFDQTR
jgi:LPS-assembly protein